MAKINIDRLYLAVVTQDDANGLTFATPEYMPGVKQMNAKPKVNTDTLYAEGVIWDQEQTLESTAIDFELVDLTNAQYAKYLGHNTAAEGGVYANVADRAPYVAVLIEATKNGGKKAYRVYYKGKLTEPDETAKGKEGKTDFQTHTVTATFQSLKNNGMVAYKIDEDDPDCPADIATAFFASVIVPGANTTVPTVTSVPADAAVGVAPAAGVVFTFSIAMQPSTITDSNVFLMQSDGTPVAAALSIDATNKVVTLQPAANLAAGDYIAVCTKGVMSAAGIPLAANDIVNFTV